MATSAAAALVDIELLIHAQEVQISCNRSTRCDRRWPSAVDPPWFDVTLCTVEHGCELSAHTSNGRAPLAERIDCLTGSGQWWACPHRTPGRPWVNPGRC